MPDKSHENLPRHVAIIMDGNGRWAASRGLARLAGHRAGVEALRSIVRHVDRLGIKWLTLYAFSSENWTRPALEVAHLFGLLKLFIRHDLKILARENIKIRVIGARDNLKEDIKGMLAKAEEMTAENDGLNLVVAFNYGARDEMVRAMRKIGQSIAAGQLVPQAITQDLLAAHLDTAGIPDPDLIIRTSGEMRLSNFLLWQAAYAEFCFVPCLWPDFSPRDFDDVLADFRHRDRRYGSVNCVPI